MFAFRSLLVTEVNEVPDAHEIQAVDREIPMNHVLEFTDVTGPGVIEESLQDVSRKTGRSSFLRITSQEMVHQQGDVFLRSLSGGNVMGITLTL